MNYSIIILSLVLSVIAEEPLQNEPPSFRIVAPQVICKSNRNSTVEQAQQITITMQTKGGQQLTYRTQIYFEVLGGYRGQQHSLKIWDSIRRLENKINVKDANVISLKNQISVKKTELTTGVYYIFKIVGFDEAGRISDPQNYTVTFSDGKIKRTNPDGSIIPDDISFLLLGAENTYGDLEYIIEAKATFCEPRFDYYYKWEMSNLTIEHQKWLKIPGNRLRIPSGILRGDDTYKIQVSLLQSNDSSVIIYQSITVKVLERGYLVGLTPDKTTTGIGKAIDFNLRIIDSDNLGILPEIQWECYSKEDDVICPNFHATNATVLSLQFQFKGEFVINATVTLPNSIISVKALVYVNPDVIVQTTFKNPPLKAISSGQKFELDATIDDLIPNCYCYWTVVNETGFEYFDASQLTNGLGNFTVLDMEGNFLSELVDYANATISRDITLHVPAKDSTIGWSGLLPDSKYKFRLYSICPAPITDVDQPPPVSENITSFSDLIVETNQAPKGQSLEINPLTGTALKTVFTFATGVASDQGLDYPLKYTFQFQVDEYIINIGEFYETTSITTLLPYSENGIRTMYHVCDSRQSCATVTGPNVSMAAKAISDSEIMGIFNEVRAAMGRMEYEYGFGVALLTGISIKNMEDDTNFEKLQKLMKEIIQNEINKLSKGSAEPYFTSHTEIVNFVRLAKETIKIFSETDDLIQNLLQLLETTSDDELSRITLFETVSKRRRKRQATTFDKRGDTTIDAIRTNLELTETLILSKNETVSKMAKLNLTDKVRGYMMKMCKRDSFTSKAFDKSLVKFEVREAKVNQIMQGNFTVPMKSVLFPAYVSLNNMLLINVNAPSTKYCVGKSKYPSDYLTGDVGEMREMYDMVVIKIDKDGKKTLIPLNDVTGEQNFDVIIPFYTENELNSIQCEIWHENVWTGSQCSKVATLNNYVRCKCNQIGFFRAVPYKSNEIGVAVATTTEPITTVEPIILATVSTVTATTVLDVTSQSEEITAVQTTQALTTEAETVGTITTGVEITELTTAMTTSTSTIISMPSTIESTTDTIPQITVATAEPRTLLATSPDTTLLLPISTTSLPNVITTSAQLLLTTSTVTQLPLSISTTTIEPLTTLTTLKDNLILPSRNKTASSTATLATTGYTLAGVFILGGLFLVLGLYVYNRRKKPNTLSQQLNEIATEIRQPAVGIKYARFHDEQNMQGDKIETST